MLARTPRLFGLLTACLAAVLAAGPVRAAEPSVAMRDGSCLTLTGIAYVTRRELPWPLRNGAIPPTATLVIWTHRTGIPWGGSVSTKTVLLDREGREYRPVYTGGFWTGLQPQVWDEEWLLVSPPAGPLRLRVTTAEGPHRDAPVEFTVPSAAAWQANAFAGRTLRQWMVEAIHRWDADVLSMLVERGAPVHLRDDSGYTALMVAASRHDLSLAQRLVQRGAALDVRSAVGVTALISALRYPTSMAPAADVVEFLLSKGADPNLDNIHVGRALTWAARRGDTRSVRALLAHGARPHREDLAAAAREGHRDVVRLLRSARTPRESSRKYPTGRCPPRRCSRIAACKLVCAILMRRSDMSKLEPVARVVRWGVESMAFNLGQLPADRLDWQPTPESKSALQITGEVLGVMRMMTGMIATGSFTRPEGAQDAGGGAIRYAAPATPEEARRQLAEAGAAFAAALESAGPELDRPVESPFGTMLASRAVLWGMIDLVHHHGQITYLQGLLGDGEMHFNPNARNWFAPDA